MSKAPKQRKVQLHYQPYQGGASNAPADGAASDLLGGNGGGGSSNTSSSQSQGGAPIDYGLSDLMDPVLTGYSSSLSRNLWDDWNENDPSLMKFDMFSDDGMSGGAAAHGAANASASAHGASSAITSSSSNAPVTTTTTATGMGFMASMMAPHASQQIQMQPPQSHQQHQQHFHNQHSHQHQQQQQQQQQQHHHQRTHDAMELDGPRPPSGNGFHSLSSQPRLSVKRSLSEDLVSMLDEDDDGHDQDPFAAAAAANTNAGAGKQLLPRGFGFGQQFNAGANSNASPLAHNKPLTPQQQQHTQQHLPQPPQMQPRSHHLQQQQSSQVQPQQGQQLLVQHATDWLNGFPAASMPAHQQQQAHQLQQQQQQLQQQPQRQSTPQPQPLSPASAAGLEAHQQRPEPSPMERASAAIASTLVAVPNPCKDHEAQAAASAGGATPTTPANGVTPSPFSAYSFMSAAMESAKNNGAGDGTGEGDKSGVNGNPFANAGMMMPGFMMYSMPMMGNYQAAAAAAAAMGMMPMGAMQMGPMGMPMGGGMPMNMNAMGMSIGPMGISPMGGMQMGMPMMQMASMGMPLGGAGTPMGMGTLGGTDATSDGKPVAPKALQPKGQAVLAPAGGAAAGGAGGAGNANFVSIARKPEEPEVSNILKSLMEEEAKKKEKKLERNRDSARESRKKQQTYVESLENGIKRLQINRDLVVSYRWGVTGGPGATLQEWKERVGIVTGRSEAFSTLQNPANFQNLMRINRQRRTLSLSRDEKERAIYKCFMAVGRQLAGLRVRLLELQVFRNLANPASVVGQELNEVLKLSEEQRLQLQCHSNRVFDQQVLAMVKLFKVFFALRAQAVALNLLSPELERYFRDVCSMEQLQKLLQWTELHRATIEGDANGASPNALRLVAA